MPKGQRVAEPLRRKIVEAFRAGATAEELQKKHGVAPSSIHRWAREIPKPNGRKKHKPKRGGPDAVEKMADALMENFREHLVHGLRELVNLGVQRKLEILASSLTAGVVEVA